MDQLPLFHQPQQTFSVTEITTHIRDLMEGDATLQDLWVQGEVSNLSRPKSGHLYFTIKDGNAALKCVMWRNNVARLVYTPRDGDAIEVHGSVSVYEASGQYQLYADQVRPAGEGLLYQEFQRLKGKLEGEGLFDPERKRPIPPQPRLIGIVTSPTGAAVRDMLNTLRRRYPLAEVVLSPASVQGEGAPAEIIAALKKLNELVKPDVILLGRGGGSIEDLWVFNDEEVARAVASSQTPIISGVGHETDFTITDFVADLRAPTPTAAAELATPDKVELKANLFEQRDYLVRLIVDRLDEMRWELASLQNRALRSSPQARLLNDRQRLDELMRRAGLLLGHGIQLKRAHLAGVTQQVAALSPAGVLARGFAVVTGEDGKIIGKLADVNIGDVVSTYLAEGNFTSNVTQKSASKKK